MTKGKRGRMLRRKLSTMAEICVNDLRGKPLEERYPILKRWYNDRLHCIDNKAHSWATHYWMPEFKAWLWVCVKCDEHRLTTVSGNYVSWRSGRTCKVLLLDGNLNYHLVLGKLMRPGIQ